MNTIDFRFRPNTPEIINGIKNSSMFKAACKAIGFDKRKPQPLEDIVADLDRLGVDLGVITGRDCETTYGFPANNSAGPIPTSLWASGALTRTRKWQRCARSSRLWPNTA